MNANQQYKKPLLLLFSDLTIDEFLRLLNSLDTIIVRQHKRLSHHNSSSLDKNDHQWKVQFEGLEFNIVWSDHHEDISMCRQIFCNIDTASFQSNLSISMGSHIEGGRKNSAIVAGLFHFVRSLIALFDPVAVIWNNSNLLSDAQYFADSVDVYEKGGAFPILSTIDFQPNDDSSITSRGLSYFADQEIYYDIGELSMIDSMKRIMRITHDIAVNGPYKSSTEVGGIEDGEIVFINVDDDTSMIYAHSVF